MGNTMITIRGTRFCINGALTYSEIPSSNVAAHGLLFNQRMIQGIFDDAGNRTRYGNEAIGTFEPERHTDALIEALPSWYAYGLRAITVGFQGGWPVGHGNVESLCNNPFGDDGLSIDAAYAARMDRVIRAADALGMVVIVNHLYWAQAKKWKDGRTVRNAVRTASRFLRDHAYTNVLIDVANEYNISLFADHPIINKPDGISSLIDIAREESGGMLTGASGGGGMFDGETGRASDFILVHGNGLTRGQYSDFLRTVRAEVPDKPIVCNEDSPCTTRVDIALASGTSWGYYNNYTKQIPPCPFGILPGEDLFFARRMARAIGIPVAPLDEQDQYVLQGLSKAECFGGLHTMRVAAEYPERIDHVSFFRDGAHLYTSYDEPFFCYTETTWLGTPFSVKPGETYRAEIHLVDGKTIIRDTTIDA